MYFFLLSIAVVPILFLLYMVYVSPLSPLFTSSFRCTISFPPYYLVGWRVAFLVVVIFVKSVLQDLGVLRSMLPSRITQSTPDTLKIPEHSLYMPFRIREQEVANFKEVTGKPAGGKLMVPQLLTFLSAYTEAAELLLVTKWTLPMKPLGGVKVRTRFELLVNPDLVQPEKLVQAKDMYIVSRFIPDGRVVKRGLEYDNESLLYMSLPGSDEPVPVFRHIIVNMHYIKSAKGVQRPSGYTGQSLDEAQAKYLREPFSLSFNSPTKWAHVSKDWNLIHVSANLAKLFGFPGKLAQGVFVTANAVTRLVNEGAFPTDMLDGSGGNVWMDVEFRRPVVVPAKLSARYTYGAGSDRNVVAFEVIYKEKVAAEGKVGFLDKGSRNT